jgi:hypothetical protein
VDLPLSEVVARQTINAGQCSGGGTDLSNKIKQAQSCTKLCNFGCAANRTKTLTAPGIGIHKDPRESNQGLKRSAKKEKKEPVVMQNNQKTERQIIQEKNTPKMSSQPN